MTCQEMNNQLDGYIAGELATEQQAAIKQHIADCADCRLELSLRRALIARARTLPRELPPQRQLWPAIANQINDKKIHPLYPANRAWLRRWETWGLAAAACVAIIALVWGIWQGETTRYISGHTGNQLPSIAPPMAEVPPRQQVAIGPNPAYKKVRQHIQQTLQLNKQELSTETMSVIEKNMGVIDDAIAQINKALTEDPENPDLQLMLVATQRQAADLLETIAEARTQQQSTTNELEKEPQ